MMMSAPSAYQRPLGLRMRALRLLAQRTRHAAEDRVRADHLVRVAAAQLGPPEQDVERPCCSLRMRHERQDIAPLVADARGAAHRAVGGGAGKTQDDAAVLFEIVEGRRLTGE